MILGNIQKIIAGIFGLLLVVILITIIWAFTQARQGSNWPPTIQNCPDYWKETSTGCQPDATIGSCSTSHTYNFNNVSYCDKYKWSIGDTSYTGTTSCNTTAVQNVPWDGINYGYGQYNPCNDNYNPQSI